MLCSYNQNQLPVFLDSLLNIASTARQVVVNVENPDLNQSISRLSIALHKHSAIKLHECPRGTLEKLLTSSEEIRIPRSGKEYGSNRQVMT